ncbi:hypothetical protein EMMF5_004542 [Cystobasidiomycetes sp. EMM_F5]
MRDILEMMAPALAKLVFGVQTILNDHPSFTTHYQSITESDKKFILKTILEAAAIEILAATTNYTETPRDLAVTMWILVQLVGHTCGHAYNAQARSTFANMVRGKMAPTLMPVVRTTIPSDECESVLRTRQAEAQPSATLYHLVGTAFSELTAILGPDAQQESVLLLCCVCHAFENLKLLARQQVEINFVTRRPKKPKKPDEVSTDKPSKSRKSRGKAKGAKASQDDAQTEEQDTVGEKNKGVAAATKTKGTKNKTGTKAAKAQANNEAVTTKGQKPGGTKRKGKAKLVDTDDEADPAELTLVNGTTSPAAKRIKFGAGKGPDDPVEYQIYVPVAESRADRVARRGRAREQPVQISA